MGKIFWKWMCVIYTIDLIFFSWIQNKSMPYNSYLNQLMNINQWNWLLTIFRARCYRSIRNQNEKSMGNIVKLSKLSLFQIKFVKSDIDNNIEDFLYCRESRFYSFEIIKIDMDFMYLFWLMLSIKIIWTDGRWHFKCSSENWCLEFFGTVVV